MGPRWCVHRSARGLACHSCWLCWGFKAEEVFPWLGGVRLKLNDHQLLTDRRSCTDLILLFLVPDFKMPNTGEVQGRYLKGRASSGQQVDFLYSRISCSGFTRVCLLSVNCWPCWGLVAILPETPFLARFRKDWCRLWLHWLRVASARTITQSSDLAYVFYTDFECPGSTSSRDLFFTKGL